MAGPAWSPTPILKAPIARSIQTSPATPTGMRKLFRQFSFPGGIPSHAAPETPGSIHEGGELGYALVHAYGAVFDNPDLIVACVVGDGEAETGPLAASWHSNKFLNPTHDGAVLPILHLNGYKIANPDRPWPHGATRRSSTSSSAMATSRFSSRATSRHDASADGATARRRPLTAFATSSRRREEGAQSDAPALADDRAAQPERLDRAERSRWPKIEGFWRAHQVPISDPRSNPEHLRHCSKQWMRSYRPEDTVRRDRPSARRDLQALRPVGDAAHGRQSARQWGTC